MKDSTRTLEEMQLNPLQPICTKCVTNLTYYDGWHCRCEVKDIDKKCWVNFGEEGDTSLKDENKQLRKVVSQVASSLRNGSVVSEEASIEFIQELPKEVSLCVGGLEKEIVKYKRAYKNLVDSLDILAVKEKQNPFYIDALK
jgi:hypothetical protein